MFPASSCLPLGVDFVKDGDEVKGKNKFSRE